jgi:putative DNA primase/helicase
MQIIIVQSEIEHAIRNYINSQLNVKDGMRIDIDLSATRGADGFKATIDIVPNEAPSAPKAAQAPEPTPTPAPASAKTETKAEAAVTASRASVQVDPPKFTPEAEVPIAGEQAAASTAGAAAEAGAAPSASAEPSLTEAMPYKPAEGSQVAAENAAAPAAPARSLFAGLKKPVNA